MIAAVQCFPAHKYASMLLGLALVSQGAIAQDDETFSLSGLVELGAEYNGNLSITELEIASGESDVAGIAEAGLDLSWQPAERWRFEGGYSYTGSRYQDIDNFDLDLHLLYGDISHEFNFITLGANHYFADANLGGDSFLTLNQSSLYAGKLFGERWFLRAALNFIDKEFDTFTDRDAENEGISLDAFWFFNEGRSSVSLGYGAEEEDTRANRFDYDGDTLRLRFNNRFTLLTREARLQLGYRWQDRDYLSVTPAIGQRRDDRHRIADAELELSWFNNFAVIGRLEHGEYASNLPSADYSETRLSLAARLSF